MKIKIDGRGIQAGSRKTILEIARENNIYIPSLCDHPRLPPFSGCRLCIVEIKGQRGYPPSCSTFVEEGMEVKTESSQLQKLRKQIMELILTEHPNACLICTEKKNCDDYKSTIRKVGETTGCVLCPNNGRCDLQDVVEALGIEKVNFPSVYRDFEVKKGDPFFDRNYNLCILCGRCMRICHEVRGASAISFVYRGTQAMIGTALDKALIDSGCQFCGACVDVCPTGALTERSMKYEPLAEEKQKTICPLCSIGCELRVELKNGRIIGTYPTDDGPVNKGQACVKGRFTVKDLIYSSKRILKPMVRKKKELEEVSWDEALKFVSQKLKKYKGKEIALFSSPQVTCEDSFVFQKFASDALKTENFTSIAGFSPSTVYQKFAREIGFESQLNFQVEDISKAKTIFLIGTDITTSHPIIWLEVLKAIRNGAKLIVASPVEFSLNRFSSVWLQTKPGTEYYLLSFLSKILLESENAPDLTQVEGWESFERSLAKLSLSQTSEVTGVSEDAIKEASSILFEENSSIFLFGMSLVQSAEGNENMAAIWNLVLQIQARAIPLGSESNQRGLLELDRTSFGKRQDINQIMKAASERKIKAVYQAGSVSHSRKIKVEFLVVQDSFFNENCQNADAILPAATFGETEGTFVNVEGRIQKSNKVIEPQGEAKPDWWIIAKLAQKMGYRRFSYKKSSEIMKEIRREIPGFEKVSYSSLKKGNEVYIQEEKRGEKKFIPVRFRPVADERSKKYPFLMFVDYNPDSYKNLILDREIKGLQAIRNSRWIKICSDDAKKLGLKEGDSIDVESPPGKIQGIVKISDFIPKGIVGTYLSWNEDSQFSVASILLPLSQDFRIPILFPVKIRRGK